MIHRDHDPVAAVVVEGVWYGRWIGQGRPLVAARVVLPPLPRPAGGVDEMHASVGSIGRVELCPAGLGQVGATLDPLPLRVVQSISPTGGARRDDGLKCTKPRVKAEEVLGRERRSPRREGTEDEAGQRRPLL